MTLHVVHFSGPITPAACCNVQSVCSQALGQGATRIRLHLASEGGSTLYGFAMYGYLKSLPIPVDTHNLGGVNSMANIVFLAGEQRSASNFARFLLHPMAWMFNAGGVDHSRLLEISGSLNDDVERYVSIFEKSTADAEEPLDIRSIISGNAQLVTPELALRSGIIHSVTDSVLPHGTPTWWAVG